MDFFAGVAHPLSYTDEGHVLPEDEGRSGERLRLMREAGVQWVTCDMPFPFEGRMGRASGALRGFLDLASEWHDAGFRVMAITPYPAAFRGVEAGGGWKVDAGRPGSPRFLRTYEEACRFLAAEFGESVSGWQIANQLNLERFRRPLSEEEAVRFLSAGGAGVKSGNPSALVGVNMFGFGPSALRMYAKLYLKGISRAEPAGFDYVGANGFFGTFEPGGPEAWYGKAALLTETTGKPVIVQELGYPSRGDVMSQAEIAAGGSHHELKKLPFVWPAAPDGGHTPESQAAYLERTFWVLSNTPGVMGAIWFSWSDRAKCWNCGAPDCPAGTSHGLVGLDGAPKPAYHAFARAVVMSGSAEWRAEPNSCTAEIGGAGRTAEPLVTGGRRAAQNEALRAKVDVLRRMLGQRDRALDRLRGSLLFRTYAFLTRPLATLLHRMARARLRSRRGRDNGSVRTSRRRAEQRRE